MEIVGSVPISYYGLFGEENILIEGEGLDLC